MGGLREKEALRIVRHTRSTSVGFARQELQKEALKCGCERLRREKTIHLSANHVHHFNDSQVTSQKVARKLHPLPFFNECDGSAEMLRQNHNQIRGSQELLGLQRG